MQRAGPDSRQNGQSDLDAYLLEKKRQSEKISRKFGQPRLSQQSPSPVYLRESVQSFSPKKDKTSRISDQNGLSLNSATVSKDKFRHSTRQAKETSSPNSRPAYAASSGEEQLRQLQLELSKEVARGQEQRELMERDLRQLENCESQIGMLKLDLGELKPPQSQQKRARQLKSEIKQLRKVLEQLFEEEDSSRQFYEMTHTKQSLKMFDAQLKQRHGEIAQQQEAVRKLKKKLAELFDAKTKNSQKLNHYRKAGQSLRESLDAAKHALLQEEVGSRNRRSPEKRKLKDLQRIEQLVQRRKELKLQLSRLDGSYNTRKQREVRGKIDQISQTIQTLKARF